MPATSRIGRLPVARPRPRSGGPSAGRTLALRAAKDARVRTIAFAGLFLLIAYAQTIAYRHAYPTTASRLIFARTFDANKAVLLFYGHAYDLLTVGGYAAWRIGGVLAIFAAVFGLLAAVRALRTEEDAGRVELVLAGCVSRGTAYGAALTAIGGCVLMLWLAESAGLVLSGLTAGPSAYLALATTSVAAVFAGVGVLLSQVAPSRRLALELGGASVGLSELLRVIADTVAGAGWVRWLTPLGWAELLRPFTRARPEVLILPVACSGALLVAAGRLARRRDLGTGLLRSQDAAPPRLRLLSSVTAQALRSERVGLVTWLAGCAAFAAVCGAIAKATRSAGLSPSLRRELAKLGSGSIVTPSGYLGLTFIFFVLAVALFAVAQIVAAGREEAEQRLDTLLALPVARRRWFTGRLALAAAGAAAISLAAALAAWLAARAGGASVPLPGMLAAGANCLAMGILFLGIVALLYGVLPRVASAAAYGLLTAAFLWQLLGSLLSVPRWTLDLSPFAHLGLGPGSVLATGGRGRAGGHRPGGGAGRDGGVRSPGSRRLLIRSHPQATVWDHPQATVWDPLSGPGGLRASDAQLPAAGREIQRPDGQEEGPPPVGVVAEAHDADGGRDTAADEAYDPEEAQAAVLEGRKQALQAGSGGR